MHQNKGEPAVPRSKPQYLAVDGVSENAALGNLIRRQREALGFTMEQLSDAAQVGRTTLHRWEHGEPGRINPTKLGRVLALLQVQADELDDVIEPETYREQVIRWMDTGQSVAEVRDFLRTMGGGSGKPDLMVFSPTDGTMLYVQVKTQGDNWEGARDRLCRSMEAAGFVVGMPT